MPLRSKSNGYIYCKSNQATYHHVCFLLIVPGHSQHCYTVKNNDSFGQQTYKKCWAFWRKQVFCWCNQFLLECCQKLIKTNNFGQNAVNKSQFKNKNEQYCAVRLFIFKVAETFCQFSVCDCRYFLPCTTSAFEVCKLLLPIGINLLYFYRPFW